MACVLPVTFRVTAVISGVTAIFPPPCNQASMLLPDELCKFVKKDFDRTGGIVLTENRERTKAEH